jgi:hypothetical protein
MTQNQTPTPTTPITPSNEKMSARDFLADHLDKLALVFWFIAAEASNLNPTIAVGGGLVVFVVLVAYSILRKQDESKLKVELEKMRVQSEQNRLWIENVGRPHPEMEREMASRQGKLSAYAAMISACEKSSRDETLSEQERLVYAKMEKRLSDMMEAVVRP